MARKSNLKNLKLKVVFSLENSAGEQISVIGMRNLFAETYSHQLIIFATMLLHDIITRVMPVYIRYLNHGTLPNEVFKYDYDGMRVAAKAKLAAKTAPMEQ